MTSQSFAFETILDNEAVLALDLRLSAGVSGPVNIPIRNALLVGIEDGAGVVRVDGAGGPRFVPIARGRVDWLGAGRLEVRQGNGGFGRALLVEVRALPHPEDESLFASGRFVEAEQALREARAVDPGDGVTRALHAESLWFAGRREEAESAFAREVALGGEGGRLAEALWWAARSGALEGPTPSAEGGRP